MNDLEETRNGYLITAQMKRVWSIQLDITRHILDVCKRHGLRVWADWGTLLGAVREKGFIPWDDDIDLMMMRDDYEKLILLADSEFRHPYFLQSFHTEKQYYRGHAQVRYDGTAAILKDDINTSVRTLCNRYGIKLIELKDIDKISGHPSVKGMQQIADQVVSNMEQP